MVNWSAEAAGPACGISLQYFVCTESAGALHHADGVDVELTGDPGLGFVLAEAEHADAGNEDDGRAGIAQCGRILECVLFVVLGIFGAVGFERGLDQLLQLSGIAWMGPT